MKLSIELASTGECLSHFEFYDVTIAEMVVFWTNIQYQSPQFPLDLSPNTTQNSTVYPEHTVPAVEEGEELVFLVTPDHTTAEAVIKNVKIIQVKLNPVELTGIVPSKVEWEMYFASDDDTYFVPDGSFYVAPSKDSNHHNSVKIKPMSVESTHYFSYSVLVSFEIEKTTYYAVFDPLMKVTSGKTKSY